MKNLVEKMMGDISEKGEVSLEVREGIMGVIMERVRQRAGERIKTAKNLRLLAAHLEGKDVLMRSYFYEVDGDGDLLSFNVADAYRLRDKGRVERTPHTCETSACALGWATTHPEMPVLPEHFGVCGGFDIDEYEAHYFPAAGTYAAVFSDYLPDEGAAQRCIDWAEILERQQ